MTCRSGGLPNVVVVKGKVPMATPLLNDDGTASMATCIMTSHHAFRRDIACFARALAAFEPSRAAAIAEEWTKFRAALHGHHTVEDTGLFPDLRAKQPELASAIDELEEHHRAIDPLLERGDRVFADLAASVAAAREIVAALAELLAVHLDTEERTVIPSLRGAKEFPAPPDDAAAAMYAEGFAWSTTGLAPQVFEQVCAMLPEILTTKLPAAREAFAARCRAVWGYVPANNSLTSVPA
jgi:hypothetical protein